ncbi:MAG: lycopene cyclase family protein [Myxococcota bacterium]
MNDILIIGSGPAALTLAAACGEHGLSVCVVAPDPDARWKQNFGTWEDELHGSEFETCVDRTWSNPLAYTPKRQDLRRSYARINTPKLQDMVHAKVDAVGVRLRRGTVRSVDHMSTHSVVALTKGDNLCARIVVDATGHSKNFLRKSGGWSDAWQTAYGQLLRVRGGHPWSDDEMVLMDFRVPSGANRGWRRRPTFLYVMPMGPDHVFVEETVLIQRPMIGMDELRARLQVRMRDVGLSVASVEEEERCVIRMIGARPVIGQRTLAFGASAGMIHPASGYSVSRVLQQAPHLAETLAAHLGAGVDLTTTSQAAWATLWPQDRQRQWELYGFGADMLCALSAAQLQQFFQAFFAMRPELWHGYLSATLPPTGIAKAMSSLFLNARMSTQRMLLSAGASRRGITLLRGMMRA